MGLKDILPKRIFPEASMPTTNVIVDSLMLEAISNSDSLEISHNEYIDTISTTENHQALAQFFKKLEKLENSGEGNIRIGYFGDSMTDGDFIVQDLRLFFQEAFGGLGIGFVSITSESAATRASIRHSYSQNWKTQSFVNIKKPNRPFGVSGKVAFIKDSTGSAWIEYKASSQKYISELHSPTLFYGISKNKNAIVEIFYNADTTKTIKHLDASKTLNTLKLTDNSVKSVKLKFKNADSIPFYGINSDNAKGVRIDNFSSRGNSGLPLSLLNPSVMQQFNKELGNYDLIVLHFGANVLNHGSLNYSWYAKGMTKVVENLKTCFPKASILIISTADKSTKYDMEMKTDAAVVPLSKSQEKYAFETQSGFINLFELMGGEGSMVKWVEGTPSMASKDYTHFNAKGSKKVAQLIYDELMLMYHTFKESKIKKTTENKKEKTPDLEKDSIQVEALRDSTEIENENIIPSEEKME